MKAVAELSDIGVAYFPLRVFATTSVAEPKPTASMNFIWQRDGYVCRVYSKAG